MGRIIELTDSLNKINSQSNIILMFTTNNPENGKQITNLKLKLYTQRLSAKLDE